ncbi:MAG: sugar transferase, partial [Nakamurella sp.]
AGALCSSVRDQPDSGYRVAGVCLLGDRLQRAGRPDQVAGYPVLGDGQEVAAAAVACGAGAVAVADFGPRAAELLPELANSLGDSGIRLMVAPGMVDFAGARTHIEQVPGLALLRIREPRFDGARAVGKLVFDLTSALLAVVLLSPLLVLSALAVLLSYGGPVVHRTRFVGRGGIAFTGWSFECSPHGVRARPVLRTATDLESGYRLPTTRVGRVLRRTGLDEAPRLINVLTLKMSLVGPRPVAVGEIGARRPPVRPGITGPWRISPDPVSSVALRESDYIDNWSVLGDMMIIVKSARLVLAGRRED